MLGPWWWPARMLWHKQASRQLPQLLPGPRAGFWPHWKSASPLRPPPDSLLEAGGRHQALHSGVREDSGLGSSPDVAIHHGCGLGQVALPF